MERGWLGALLLVMNLTLLHQPYEFNFADGNGQRFRICMLQQSADEKTSQAVGPNSANHPLDGISLDGAGASLGSRAWRVTTAAAKPTFPTYSPPISQFHTPSTSPDFN